MINESLKREIGVVGLAANTINLVIGAGIFILPPLVATYLGGASILAYIFCGILMFTIILCFAEVGSQVTTTGGAYAYIHAAFGPFFGFLANSLFWFGTGVIMNAAVINAMADMLSLFFPILISPIYRALFFLFIFGGFAWINVRGVKYGNQMVTINTFIKLIPLLLLITFGWLGVSSENLRLEQWPSLNNIGGASLLLFFAFGGGEASLSVSGEIKKPNRTIPLGILLGMSTIIILYMLIQTVAQGVLGATLANQKEAPLAVVAAKVFGKIGAGIMIGGAIFSIFGSLSGGLLAYPRVLFAGAEKGWLPAFMAKVHSKYATPYWAIIIYASLDFIFAISGGFKQLAVISSASLLFIYLGVVLATIRLRMKNQSLSVNAFKLPGGLTIPTIAIISIFWFLSNLAVNEWLSISIFLLILSIIYWVMKRLK